MNRNRVMKTILALLALLVAGLVPVAVVAPGAQAAGGHKHFRVLVGSQTKNEAIQGMRFLPGRITIDAGDTVAWIANGAEIHTVTFFKGGHHKKKLPAFNPGNIKQLTRQGGSVYTPKKHFNSGLMTTVPTGQDSGPLPPVPHVQKYRLLFPHTGRFTYYCLVHGLMMTGTVIVQPHGTAYPKSQDQIDQQARADEAALNAEGRQLRADLRQQSTNHKVFAGDDNGRVMVMRFVRRTVTIHVGQRVRFLNIGGGAPHTVTFGKEPPPPGLFGPSGDPKHFKGGNLNSGIIGPGGKFTVTFLKAGTFHYVCALHDFMGMKGKVVVKH